MRARDIMTRTVQTVERHTPVREVIRILLERRISGVPVVEDGRVVGIVTEGDLILRERAHRQRGGMAYLFQQLFEDHAKLADEYRKAHGIVAEDVMTRDVVTIRPGTPVEEIANLLAERHIKRVPVVDRDRLVGIVSRADVLKAAADRLTQIGSPPRFLTDREIEQQIVQSLATEPWAEVDRLEIESTGGQVTLRGTVENEAEREAVEVAAREVPGVKAVTNELVVEARPTDEAEPQATR